MINDETLDFAVENYFSDDPETLRFEWHAGMDLPMDYVRSAADASYRFCAELVDLVLKLNSPCQGGDGNEEFPGSDVDVVLRYFEQAGFKAIDLALLTANWFRHQTNALGANDSSHPMNYELRVQGMVGTDSDEAVYVLRYTRGSFEENLAGEFVFSVNGSIRHDSIELASDSLGRACTYWSMIKADLVPRPWMAPQSESARAEGNVHSIVPSEVKPVGWVQVFAQFFSSWWGGAIWIEELEELVCPEEPKSSDSLKAWADSVLPRTAEIENIFRWGRPIGEPGDLSFLINRLQRECLDRADLACFLANCFRIWTALEAPDHCTEEFRLWIEDEAPLAADGDYVVSFTRGCDRPLCTLRFPIEELYTQELCVDLAAKLAEAVTSWVESVTGSPCTVVPWLYNVSRDREWSRHGHYAKAAGQAG